MRQLLRVEPSNDPQAVKAAERAMSSSILISGIRCLLTYLVIPLAGPTAILGGFSRPLSALLCVLGAYMSVRSMRRFWRSNHRYRWAYTAFAACIIVFLAYGFVTDVVHLVG